MGFCDLPVVGKVCAVGDAVDFATDPGKAIGNWLATSAGELAATSADLAATAVNTTTKVDLNAPWFRDNYQMLLPLGLVLLVATFCAQLIRAALRRDGQALTQAFTGTASGVIFAFAAIALTTVAIEVVDALSDGLFRASHLTIETAVRRIVKVSEIGAIIPMGWLIATFAGLGAALGAVLYWCVMMVRKVGILVMVTLAIFASAGGGWEATRRWRRGWIEATATLVVSKLLMTVIFVLGIAAMGNTESKDGIGALADVMSGIVIMIMVLLCPYAVFKFVHWAADGTDGESIHRAGGAGAQIARQHAEKAARKAAAAATAGAGGGAAAGAEAAPQGPDATGDFPGDIAPNPTGTDNDSAPPGLEQTVQPPPMNPSDNTNGQPRSTEPNGPGPNAAPPSQGNGWQSVPPITTPPQGAPPAPMTSPAPGLPMPPAGL
ncbi:ATP-binding protein [Streptomyces sp. SID13666]|uniref:SCO6881 family protein n=1 Tax=unclassified Streptomyces TaxID=2593676 RepID=UPI0013BEE0EA|nr:ATP-binding protein [Streptomyces sp. H39-C1]MCZ4101299.1 ATP-binding protein [Streptomyces sp. H39-C1]NEA60185.1 ATP-binding protein [Streptomyces sp. SID13666]